MRGVLRLLTGRSTWTRAVHLALGAWVAVACALVWPGLEDAAPRTLAGLHLAPLPLLALLACVPAVRRSEGVQARALLLPGDDEVTVEPARTWGERGRLLLWLLVRVELGVLAAELTALAVWTLAGLLPGRWVPAAAGVPPAVVVLLLWVLVLAGLGALTAAVARRLLHPSPAERLAAQQARTERLLERTRLAAELHDSIGHALTVTLLQAGAARDVAGRDPAFVDRALAAIEDSARSAAADLDRVLALLRDSSPAPAAPTLADVGGLVRAAEAAGARVDVRVDAAVAGLPEVLSREAYRIVQEALTNALRHAGPVPVRLEVGVDDGELLLGVRNPVPAPVVAGRGGGSGVRGLHERAAVLGGTALAGPDGDGWRVEVRLPLGGSA
ncbi:Signal transduction histidine kinase [Geodermatophilus amargosae]|uniref:histidine kinase n=1 Tax=Geodermatophilus amargosae TaxID=1296565 RepID=A0A1I7CKH6_9ACTN|nr:histidine kinase [Geodermatophilus amargosae]SFT99884.1 Signal transduction histidine kinase [Geodermatophilus amargosae]